MGFLSEIYFTKNFIVKEEWLKFIKTISNYNGPFRKWKIIITNCNNQIRYFVKTRCTLPTTINQISSFLLKQIDEIIEPKSDFTLLSLPRIGSSIIDLINDSEIRNKGMLVYLEISFRKLYEDHIKTKVIFYLEKNGIIKKYYAIFAIPINILSVDFESNKRYFYKSPPKYLEIHKILHLLNTDFHHALFQVDTYPYLQGNFYLNQNGFHFDKHSIVMGSSGSGKSKFISLFIYNIIKNEQLNQKYKVVVIDPHADLENDIGGFGKVIDFKSVADSIDLFINHSHDIVVSTELLLELFQSLICDQYNSKLERVLRHSIYLLLADQSFNFSNLRKLILNLEFRNELIKKLKYTLPVSVIDFFLSDFNDLKTKSYGEAISPIIGFIDEMEMIPVFSDEQNTENLKNTIQDNSLTLFSLDRTHLGDKVTKTIAGLVMQQLLTIIQNREIDEHIIFIIDEVAIVENPILARFLSEARKYHLSLILAGQYFNQLSMELKNSIFANVVNYYIFRISKLDATTLVDNFNMKIPLNDSKEQKIKMLTEMNDRECIVRVNGNGILLPAFRAKTLDFKSVPRIKRTLVDSKKIFQSNQQETKFSFELSPNINLKEILISHSTGKKGVD